MLMRVLLLALGLLGSAMAQTCPSYTAGYTGNQYLHDSSSGMLYVNESPSLRAPCDGTVYRWHYCYYPVNNENDVEVAFGAFRAVTDEGELERYYLRDGSYHLLHLDSRENSFTCDTVDLDPQNYFTIFEDDRVGACMRSGANEFLDILAESAPNSLRVGQWGSSSGSCAESNMAQSSEEPDTEQGMVLHLYVDINIDECVVDEDNCHSTLATCTDVVGGQDSFNCTCITGYTGDGVTCSNIDECQLGLDACVENSDCSDTVGSYDCTCSTGFNGDGLVNCENVDKCNDGTDMCHAQATCTDSPGSYICTCTTGYTGSGLTCNDIDECEDGTDSCDENADCTNTDGSYTCSCQTGFTADGITCADIDECENSSIVCGLNTTCTNNLGSYECSCDEGYRVDGILCVDINECEDGIDSCDENADCTNTDGGYTCSCLSGYSGDGMTCDDINECVSGSLCDQNAECTNTAGSYTCQCATDYSGDGNTCEKISVVEEESKSSGASGNSVLLAILGVLGALLALSVVIVIVAVCIVRGIRPSPLYKMRNDMTDGMTNAVYSSTTDEHYAVNTRIYDYPTLPGSTDAKPPVRSPPPLDFYTSAEVVILSLDHSSVAYRKASGTMGEYEVPYYTPASEEQELYSQLRHEKIKAIPKEEIEIAERLGGGEFGDVVRGYWKSIDYSVEVALKTLSGAEGTEGRRKLLQEAAIMSQFRHPHVVKLYGVISDNQQLMLVLELLGKGDLRQLLLTMRPDPGQLISPQTPKLLLNYCQQIAEGLQYLSRKNFVHRDLAARNILISTNNTCKISDFGMARNLIEDDYYVSHGGKIPIKWTAPEALIYRKYTTSSDVWSYGCVLYEMWSLGHKPFESMTNQEVLVQVESGYRLPPPPGCPQVIYGIMIRCWNPETSSRPTVAEIMLALTENEEVVLKIPEDDAATRRLAGVLGAPLDEGQDMYPDMQETYYSSLQA